MIAQTKKAVKIDILGQAYHIKTDEGEERINQIVDHLNRNIEEVITASQNRLSPLNTMVLAALNITSEYLKLKEEKEVIITRIKDQSGKLIKTIEKKLEGKEKLPCSVRA